MGLRRAEEVERVRRIAIDIGDTYTDAAAAAGNGRMATAKTDTTPDDVTGGVLNACAKLAGRTNQTVDDFLGGAEVIVLAGTVGAAVDDLADKLRRSGFAGRLLLGGPDGTAAVPDGALHHTASALSSGPAAIPSATRFYGGLLKSTNILSLEMGGSGARVVSTVDGEVSTSGEEWPRPPWVGLPAAKVPSISVGGSSIAWIDSSGAVEVGPRSVQPEIGPACYAKGGVDATVTDADLVLRYLDADNFAGGDRILDVHRAEQAVEENIAKPLGLGVQEAAGAIVTRAVRGIAGVIRGECLEREMQPRDFTMMAAGGAGPVHAALVAKELGITRIVVPSLAATFCAFGWLRSDVVLDFVRSEIMATSQSNLPLLASLYGDMEREARRAAGGGQVKMTRLVEARCRSQRHDVAVEIPAGNLGPKEFDAVVEALCRQHEVRLHEEPPGAELELIRCRVRALVPVNKPEPRESSVHANGHPMDCFATRECVFGKDRHETAIYQANQLYPGNSIKGPAIIEQRFTTVVVPPHFVCRVDAYGSYLLEKRR